MGIGEILQADLDKLIDPHSPVLEAILPWRDSSLGQGILKKLCEKYSMDPQKNWSDQPEWFLTAILEGDGELLRVKT